MENSSGHYTLPLIQELRQALDEEMVFRGEISVEGSIFSRSLKEPKGVSFEESNEIMKNKGEEARGKKVEKKEEPVPAPLLEKKVEELSKTLEAFINKMDKRQLDTSVLPPVKSIRGPLVCWYCHQEGHSLPKCRRMEEDIRHGLLRKEESNGRTNYLLPNGTQIYMDPSRPMRSIVAAYSPNVPPQPSPPAHPVQPSAQAGILHINPQYYQSPPHYYPPHPVQPSPQVYQPPPQQSTSAPPPSQERQQQDPVPILKASCGILESWNPPAIKTQAFSATFDSDLGKRQRISRVQPVQDQPPRKKGREEEENRMEEEEILERIAKEVGEDAEEEYEEVGSEKEGRKDKRKEDGPPAVM